MKDKEELGQKTGKNIQQIQRAMQEAAVAAAKSVSQAQS